MANCPNCGAAIRPGETYCVKCGTTVESPAMIPPPPPAPADPLQYQTPQGPADKGWAGTTSLICGILSLAPGICCGCIGLPAAIAGIVFGILGLKSSKNSLAKIGIGLCVAGILLFVILIILQLAFHLTVPGSRGGFPR